MILVNGTPGGSLSPLDRGLAYGDGVFRTFPMRHCKPFCWHRQFGKLEADCENLGIACPAEDVLLREISELAAEMPDCVVKIIVTRGAGGRGYAAAPSLQPTRIIIGNPLPQYPASHASAGVKARICATRVGWQPRLAGVKHLNRLENVLARLEWDDPGIAEGLMLDMEDNAIEGTMSNIFAFRDGTLFTPDLSRCGVAGVQRSRILEAASASGIPARIKNLPVEDLLAAEEIMLCNSVIGLWQVRELAGKIWEAGKVTARLRQLLDDEND